MLLLLSYFSHFLLCGPRVCFFSMFSCVCVFQMMQAACVHLCDPYSHPSTILLSFFSVYSEGFLLKFSIAAYLNLWRFFPLSNRSFWGGWSGVIRSNFRQCEVKDRTAAAIRIEKILWRNTSEGKWIAILEPQTVRSEQWRRWTAYSRLVPDNSTWKKTRKKDWRWRMSAESIRLQMCLDGSLLELFEQLCPLVPINLLFLDAMDPIVAFGPPKNQFTTSFLQHLVLPLE